MSINAIDRRAAQRALQALADRYQGLLTPELVVEAARDPTSELHGFFTWDDAEAAIQHRLAEARSLIRSVKVEVRLDRVTVQAPFFVRDPATPAKVQGYASLGRLKTDTDLAREAVLAEFARASSALQRARALAAALDLAEEVTTLADRLDVVRAAVANGAGSTAAGIPS